MPTLQRSRMIKVSIGDPVRFPERESKGEGIVEAMALIPNSVSDPSLVCLLKVRWRDGSSTIATSNRFQPVEDYDYKEQYPCLL